MNLGPAINTSSCDAVPSLSRDGHWLFFHSTRPGGHDGWDIWMAWRPHVHDDFSWQEPVNLLSPINTPFSELNGPYFDNRPSIRADGRELVMFSDRAGTYGGVDLWTSTRDSVFDPWSTPVNLGPVVNSAFVDFLPELSSDRQALYFSSNRPGGYGNLDLYVSTRHRTR